MQVNSEQAIANGRLLLAHHKNNWFLVLKAIREQRERERLAALAAAGQAELLPAE